MVSTHGIHTWYAHMEGRQCVCVCGQAGREYAYMYVMYVCYTCIYIPNLMCSRRRPKKLPWPRHIASSFYPRMTRVPRSLRTPLVWNVIIRIGGQIWARWCGMYGGPKRGWCRSNRQFTSQIVWVCRQGEHCYLNQNRVETFSHYAHCALIYCQA